MGMTSGSVLWRDLETLVGLDDLPAFHRAFLVWREIKGVDDMPLLRVKQRVEAELNRMVLQGLTKAEGDDDWEILPGTLDTFAAAQPYLKPMQS